LAIFSAKFLDEEQDNIFTFELMFNKWSANVKYFFPFQKKE